MPTVLITPSILQEKTGKHCRILESAGFRIRCSNPTGGQLYPEQVPKLLEGVHGVLAGPEPYTAEIFAKFRELRVISRTGVGYDAIDIDAATRHRVLVAFTPGTNHEAVAEQVFCLMFGLVRHVVENHHWVMIGKFERRVMQPIRGQALGIIGLGRIGRAVAVRGLAFGMKVLVHEPYCEVPQIDAGPLVQVDLDELFGQSDIITLHAPLTQETRHLIRKETITKMKEGAILINTSRGGLVDETALAEALESGKLGAAGLDVFENEPPEGSPILSAPNVLFSPHVAAMDTDAIEQMAVMAAQTVIDLHEGRWPAEKLVNAESLGPGWTWEV